MSPREAAHPIGSSPEAQAAFPSEAQLRDYVVEHIEEAVEKGWVRPYFQPVIRTLSGKLCGAEALARWEDPTYGLLSPVSFIGALEDARLIHLLDCSIIEQICRQYRTSVDRGEPVVPFSFNLSRLDFDLCDIFRYIEDCVHRYEVPRSMLNIEITETSLATDSTYMGAMMRKFHDVGYQVWMDDFGSGYSTLNALKDFDFDELKIDMEFLNRFGEKSKTILASVVDMAKKLGIQTLAEGVENEDHRRYLRRIGCEKMQGYLFGKPEPYDSPATRDVFRTFGVESVSERLYISEVGAVNTLSLSERDLTANSSTYDYLTSMPLAMVEYEDGKFRIIDANRVFLEGLENVGVPSIEEAERRINDSSRTLARQARRLVSTIVQDEYARIDYVAGDIACVMRARHITTRYGKTAVLVSIDDTIEQNKHRRHERMVDALSVLYSIYEHVDFIDVEEDVVKPVFDNAGYHYHLGDVPISVAMERFAEAEVYPSDRRRFLSFSEPSTLVRRIHESGENFLTDFFRLRQHAGNYVWKLFGAIQIEDRPTDEVLLCIRGTHWSNDGLLQAAFDSHSGDASSDPTIVEMTMTDGSLWRSFIRGSKMGVFWKDRERRFAGANATFLEYYGFDSVEEILGKTDEDMQWHIDPVPFMNDELRVLNEGVSIDSVRGNCIVKGEVRDIMATKRPVYRNGRIVGLVGYFVDVTDRVGESDFDNIPLHDVVTGVLNYTGLEAATWRYVDAYKRHHVDFAMVSVNVEDFKEINDQFGYEFGDKVLRRVGDELREVAGKHCVIGHVFAERFVVLVQGATDEELSELCDEIEKKLMGIARIDNTPCTVYAIAEFSLFSEFGNVEAMKRNNQEARALRRGKWPKNTGEDVITSNLL